MKNLSRRGILLALTTLVFVFALLAFSACSTDKQQNYTIFFVVDGKTRAIVTTDGSSIVPLPEDPTKENYVFDGWYYDESEWTAPFTSTTLTYTPISADTFVYAKWSGAYELVYDGRSDLKRYTVIDCIYYTEEEVDVIIPDTYNGTPVTAIKKGAFSSNKYMRTLTIPDSVVTISDRFSGCRALTGIYVGEHNTKYLTIDGNLYDKDATKLIRYAMGKNATSFEVPDTVTHIGDYAFRECFNLTEIVMYDGVVQIGNHAFLNCSSLKKITLPDSITDIGESAFYNCYMLTSVDIPSGLTILPRELFYGCSSLKQITIPDNITSLGFDLFYYCSSLTTVTIGSGVNNLETWYKDKTFEQSEERAEKVTTVSPLFGECVSLKNIIVSEENPNYTSINGNLYNKDVTAMYQYAIGKTDTEFVVLNGVKSIMATAFAGSVLEKITFPDTVTEIHVGAFAFCSRLIDFVVPDTVTELGRAAFAYCSSLTSIATGDGLSAVSIGLLKGCTSLKSVTIGNNIETIGSFAFLNCTSLQKIVIPDNVTAVNQGAFYGCTSLTAMSIGNGIKSLGPNMFFGCDSLVVVTVGDGVKTINDETFAYCSSLFLIAIGSGVKNIGTDVFIHCDSLSSILVSDDNPYYKSVDGNLYTSDMTTLVQYSVGKTAATFTVPDTVTTIGTNAFYRGLSLTSVTMGDNVTVIGDAAFSACYNLTSVTLGNNVTAIGDAAFSSCYNLTTIILPKSLTRIGDAAFVNCDKLRQIHYYGTQEDFDLIDIGKNNDVIAKAVVICHDALPSKSSDKNDGK